MATDCTTCNAGNLPSTAWPCCQCWDGSEWQPKSDRLAGAIAVTEPTAADMPPAIIGQGDMRHEVKPGDILWEI